MEASHDQRADSSTLSRGTTALQPIVKTLHSSQSVLGYAPGETGWPVEPLRRRVRDSFG